EYCYRVRAVGPKGLASEFSSTACATPPVPTSPPPAAPSNLVATATSPSDISLTWTDHASNEQGFEIWRSTSGIGGAYALLQSVGPNTSTGDDNGLTSSTEYCYQVRAIGGSGVPASEFTPASCATTPAAPPAAPSNLAATAASSTTVSLVWTDNAADEQGFQLWRSTTGANGTYTLLNTLGANVTAADDNGLTPGAQYCYKIRATGAGPSSEFSNNSCATTPLAPPATPTDLEATPKTSTKIDLAWQDNATDEANYEVWRSTSGSSGSYTLRSTRAANSESYSDTGLSPNTEYCYKVRATGANGAPDSPFTGPSCATTLVVVRVVTFGDSNTDTCEEDPTALNSYVSSTPRLGPNDPHLPCQLAGKIEAKWQALRAETVRAVNHGIGSTTTGGLGGTGDATRTARGAPNARTSVNGTTRFEGEVLGTAYPWSGGEPTNQWFPTGPVPRVNAFVPGANDFAYVSMGTNDDAGATRTLTAAQTGDNLRWMAQKWIDAGKSPDHFIITTLAPRDDANSPTSIHDRNVLIRAIAADLGLHLIDICAHVSDDDCLTWKSSSFHISDGIHYTDAVRGWIADQIVSWMSAETSSTP
ncbi:MAG TPA: fibronectin type III domain-containing protein, partial [Gemmatimonadales bacterium]